MLKIVSFRKEEPTGRGVQRVVFGGGSTPYLIAPGVIPGHIAPPKNLTLSSYTTKKIFMPFARKKVYRPR